MIPILTRKEEDRKFLYFYGHYSLGIVMGSLNFTFRNLYIEFKQHDTLKACIILLRIRLAGITYRFAN